MHTHKLLFTPGIALYSHQLPAQSMPDSIIVRRTRDAWQEMNAASAQQLAAHLRKDGTWNDIDYKDRRKGGWKPFDHITRLRTMAIACARPHDACLQR